jgi:hypothetical protein
LILGGTYLETLMVEDTSKKLTPGELAARARRDRPDRFLLLVIPYGGRLDRATELTRAEARRRLAACSPGPLTGTQQQTL